MIICRCGGTGLILLPDVKLPEDLAEALKAYVPCLECETGREHAAEWT